MPSYYRRKLLKFHAADPRCHWCECPTIIMPQVSKMKKGKPPENAATIDHLRSRYHPGRQEPANGEKRLVLSCWRCNQERNRQEEIQLGNEELTRRQKEGMRVKKEKLNQVMPS